MQRQLMDDVIEIAKKDFVNGGESVKAFTARILEQNKTAAPEDKIELAGIKNPSIRDSRFKRHANWIPDTRFVATDGPQKNRSVIDLIEDTAYHELSIKHIVAFAEKVHNKEKRVAHTDFRDYGVSPGNYKCGPYKVWVEKLDGACITYHRQGTAVPCNFVKSKLHITRKKTNDKEEREIFVTTIKLRDGYGFDLSNDPNDELKEVLWKSIQLELKHPVLVHCRAGCGRTGHYIFIGYLINYCPDIFTSTDPNYIATRCLEALAEIRKTRPALLTTLGQFKSGIRSAFILQDYALRKGYIGEQRVVEAADYRPGFFTPTLQRRVLPNTPTPQAVSKSFKI